MTDTDDNNNNSTIEGDNEGSEREEIPLEVHDPDVVNDISEEVPERCTAEVPPRGGVFRR